MDVSNTINTNYTAGIYSNSVSKQAKSSQTGTKSFADKVAEKRESAVDQYKKITLKMPPMWMHRYGPESLS